MLAGDKISKKALSTFNEPLDNRGIDDVRATLDGVTKLWETRECIGDKIVHSACLVIEKSRNE